MIFLIMQEAFLSFKQLTQIFLLVILVQLYQLGASAY